MSVLDFVLVTKSCLIAGKVNKKHCMQYLQFLQQAVAAAVDDDAAAAAAVVVVAAGAAAAGAGAAAAAVKRNPDAGSRRDKC